MAKSRNFNLKIIGLLIWTCLVLSFFSIQQANNLSVLETSLLVFDFISATNWGPVLYILVYAVRPLTFFPGSFLTILSGVFFGLWGGVIYTIIGANLSASLAYLIGRFFSPNEQVRETRLGNWISQLQDSPFVTTLVARLIFLPFDLVNYVGGILKLPFLPYLFATIIGTLLGITTFVSIGASLDIVELRSSGFSTQVVDANFILLSFIIFVVSLLLSKLLKQRKKLSS